MNEEESPDNPEGLTLPFVPGNQPFALSEDEERLSPDDWAWLFLSLNEDYRAAYAEYRNRYDLRTRGGAPSKKAPLLSRYIFDADDRKMMPDEDGFSARVFGIGAWLSPSVDRLPEINDGSWFFPLKRIGSTNRSPPKSSDRPHPHRASPYTQSDSAVHPLITETPFGYYLRTEAPPSMARDVYRSTKRNWILTVIDCRIPPAAQVASAKTLADLTRKLVNGSGRGRASGTSPRVLVDAPYLNVSSYAEGKMPDCRANSWADLPEGMHALAIDSHDFSTSDTAAALLQLNEKHRALIMAGKAERSPLRDLRFKSSLPSAKDSDGILRNGGSRLKALHVIAELTDRGVSKKQIAEITRTEFNGNSYEHLWRKNFQEEISNYVDDAKALVEGGYRWLVQAQKPDYTPQCQPTSKPNPSTFRKSR